MESISPNYTTVKREQRGGSIEKEQTMETKEHFTHRMTSSNSHSFRPFLRYAYRTLRGLLEEKKFN
jgi:hypothetical protein